MKNWRYAGFNIKGIGVINNVGHRVIIFKIKIAFINGKYAKKKRKLFGRFFSKNQEIAFKNDQKKKFIRVNFFLNKLKITLQK